MRPQPPAAARTRIGVVGAGAIVRKVHLPVLAHLPQATVAWIADRDEPRARLLARDFQLAVAAGTDPAGWPDCDLVLLATPLFAREPYLTHYAQRRIPVLAEKPFAVDGAEHAERLRAFGETPVFCAYMRRSYAQVLMLRRLVASGCFGPLRHIRYAEGGRTTQTAHGSATLDLGYRDGGGVLRDLGCHGLDALLSITGARAHRVIAARILWDGQTDREVQAELEFDPAAAGDPPFPVRFSVSWLHAQDNRIDLVFERAAIRCGIKPGAPVELAPEGDFARALALQPDAAGARGEYASYYAEWADVLGALREGTVSGFTAASSLATTALVESIYAAGGAP